MPRETVRKGFRIAARASILAPHSSEIGLFRPFRGLLRLQFGARGDFSDSLRETVRKGSRVATGASILLACSGEIGLFDPFRGLLRLQFRACQGFSDSFSETVWKVSGAIRSVAMRRTEKSRIRLQQPP